MSGSRRKIMTFAGLPLLVAGIALSVLVWMSDDGRVASKSARVNGRNRCQNPLKRSNRHKMNLMI